MNTGVGTESEKAMPAFDGALILRLLRRARPLWPGLGLAALLLLAASFLEQAKPALTGKLIDSVVGGDPAATERTLQSWLLCVGAVLLVRPFQTFWISRVGQNFTLELRTALFRKIHAQPFGFLDTQPVGALMTRVVYDVETLEDFFNSGLTAIFADVFTVAVIFWALLRIDGRLALVSVCLMPLLVWATAAFRKRNRENFRKLRRNNAEMNAFLSENVAGMATVQAFNRERRNATKFDAINSASLGILLEQIRLNAFFQPLVELLAALTTGVLLWYGGLRAFAGVLTLGSLVAALMYVQRLYEPLKDLTEVYGSLQSAMASAERVFALLDREEEVEDPETPASADSIRGAIEFRAVSFAYVPGRPALRALSFRADPGEHVAVVGPSGAGKTTLIHLLLRFYSGAEGSILLDGRPLEEYSRKQYLRRFALVPQEPFLFSGSILENIRLSDPTVPRERVEWACAQVRADRFVARMAGGFDAPVVEGGANLSTGQKQLLSFARALAFDPAVLLLDEATASVDTETEAEIQAALKALLKGRTTLSVAHRLSTVRDADRILVLKDGALVEEGRHAELMAKGGLYRGLVELQFRDHA
jgi:ATP-binding cassette subfamily B protein